MSENTTDTPITDEAWGKPYTRQDHRLHAMRRTCIDLERQLAEAIKARTDYFTAWQRVRTKRNKAIEQRDRLAEALRMLMDIIGPKDLPAWADDDQIDAAYDAGELSLAALNQPETKP